MPVDPDQIVWDYLDAQPAINRMMSRWYARENDLIGGYCIMPTDEPPSTGTYPIGDFLSQEVAMHVAALHNDWLERCVEVRAAL